MTHLTPWLALTTALLATPSLAGGSALVTLSSGGVQLGADSAPAAPFVLAEGQSLQLAEGASVVVLHEGTATRLRGPRAVSVKDLASPSVGSSASSRGALTAVLSREVSFAKAGASRGDSLALTRPMPGGKTLSPKGFTWTCAECGPQQVALTPLMADAPIWSKEASSSAAYDGPPLAPGPYLVQVGSQEFAFTVVDQAHQKATALTIEQAASAIADLKAQGVSEPAAFVSIHASVLLQSGLPSDALWAIDEAVDAHPKDEALRALRTSYEQQLGLSKP